MAYLHPQPTPTARTNIAPGTPQARQLLMQRMAPNYHTGQTPIMETPYTRRLSNLDLVLNKQMGQFPSGCAGAPQGGLPARPMQYPPLQQRQPSYWDIIASMGRRYRQLPRLRTGGMGGSMGGSLQLPQRGAPAPWVGF